MREALPFVERVMVEIPASSDVKNNTVNFARTVRATLGPVKAPEPQIACQAEALAMYTGMTRAGVIDEALKSQESFLRIAYGIV